MATSNKRKTLSTSISKKTGTSKSKGMGTSRSSDAAPPLPYDQDKFVSWDTQDCFHSKEDKKPVSERGINVGALLNECPKVHDELVHQGLGVFFEEPDEANLSIMREFYVNFSEHEDCVCNVRKKKDGYFGGRHPTSIQPT